MRVYIVAAVVAAAIGTVVATDLVGMFSDIVSQLQVSL